MDNTNEKMPLPKGILGCIIKFSDKKEQYGPISLKVIGFYMALLIFIGGLYFIFQQMINQSASDFPLDAIVSTVISLSIAIFFAKKIEKIVMNYSNELKNFFEENFSVEDNEYYIKFFKLEKDTIPLMGIIISLLYSLLVLLLTDDSSMKQYALNIKACVIVVFITMFLTSILPNMIFYSSMIIDLENIGKKKVANLDMREYELDKREKEIDEKEIIAIRYTNKMR